MNSELIEELGARYFSTKDISILDGSKQYGPFDIIFEATGNSTVVFESMRALGKNGVLVLSSVTGGNNMIQVPADRINLEFVLETKSWWVQSMPTASTLNLACVNGGGGGGISELA